MRKCDKLVVANSPRAVAVVPLLWLMDRVTGWTRHATRWNETSIGRRTTTHPITRLEDPNNANPYIYAADNPCNNTDPTGQRGLELAALSEMRNVR